MKRPIIEDESYDNRVDGDKRLCNNNNNNNDNNNGIYRPIISVKNHSRSGTGGAFQMLEMETLPSNNGSSSGAATNNASNSSSTSPAATESAADANSTNNNQQESAKKVKLNQDDHQQQQQKLNEQPSRVVHIRNIPSDVSETEIVHLGIPFGRVSNVLVLKGKNQAFLELAEESAAISMVSYFTNCVAQLRGRSVYVQYSTHKELKTDQSHSNANSAAQAALQAAQALVVQQQHQPLHQNSNNQALTNNGSSNTSSNDVQGGPNTVLRVIVEQMLYPVTLDVLYQIFSRVGKVLRIVTFTKNNFFQALIQYPDVVMAQAAKLTLDGQNIYNGCCTLRIEYSKLSSLNVRYNNEKSRDYTNPNLPTGENTNADLLYHPHHPHHPHHHPHPHQNGVLGQFQTQQQQLAAALLGINNGAVAGAVAGPHQMAAAALAQQHGFLAAMLPSTAGGNSPSNGTTGSGGFPGGRGISNGTAGSLLVPGSASLPGCVLLVSNLNEELITPDALFTLFGVYGDVQRVKILFNKKDSALVQMREPAQAQLALTYLDRLKLQGKLIRVTLSKHGLVQMPKEGQPDAGLTKDYTTSPLHRFKKPDSKNYQNIYAPSATLHLSNIPASVTEEEILQAFRDAQFDVKAFKFFPKDRKMALLQLPTIEEAAEALIKMHNYQLRENSHLRVSFSKSTI